MATIGKIRKHSTLLLIMVGGALALFVLSDFFGQSGQSRPKQYELAVVGGKKIAANEFYNKLDEQIEMYKMQYGDNLESAMLFQIREEVFNEIIRQTILQKEYEKIGLKVSKAEMLDMMTGVNIHPIIRQNFTDPQTGMFNPAFVTNYLQNLETMDPQQQTQWITLEKIMKEERFFTKYQNLIKKSYFVPKAMAASMYTKQGTTGQAKVISLKYSSIPDEEVTLTDKDYKDFYEKHKHEYDQEESRWLDYVVFDVIPSPADVAEGEVFVHGILEEFEAIPQENTMEIFSFVNLKSDIDFTPDTSFLKRNMLPAEIDSIFDMPKGSIIGPYSENNSYFIVRLIDKQERSDSMRASHILIPYRGTQNAEPSVTRTKEEAQAIADSLFLLVKGADSTKFAGFAVEHSSCPSGIQSGGDLDWFADGRMIPEFNEACQKGKPGEFFITESIFGYHIIKLTGKKAFEPKVKIAMLKYTNEASESTVQQIYTEASKFAGDNQSIEAFAKAAEDKGYILRTSEYTRTSDYSIPGILEGREIIRWAFGEEIETGKVSPVFELIGENKNVVVLVKQVRKKGIAPLEQIKEMIEPLVKKEKKAQMLIDKMNQAKSGTNSIEDIARKLGIEVLEVDFVSFGSPNVPGIGPEPKVVGTIFGTEKGKISRTIKGEAAVFVVFVTEITTPPPTNDYSMILFNQMGFFQNRVSFDVYNSLLKKAEVRDNKVKFY